MTNRYFPPSDIPISKPKPLAAAVRGLIASGLVVGAGVSTAKAEAILPVDAVPVPTANIDIGALRVEIAAGQAKASRVGNAMLIDQTVDKATLDWKSFDIGTQSSVEFKQPASSSVALNNIHDNDASQIMGRLTANGQVYLINQNGFLFGANSQVNVNSLVASTLGISQSDFQAGIFNAFRNRQAAGLQGNGEIYVKDKQGNFVLDANQQKIKIQVFIEDGAQIKTNAAGGRVVIAAPVIENRGSIETPDGQTILAASTDKVYLQDAGADSDIRGMLVEVGTGGSVTNVGKVLAERGNASLIGFAVNQKGVVSATTSTQLNGSVRLLAREGIVNPSTVNNKLVGKSTQRVRATEDGLGSKAIVQLAPNSITSVDLDADKSITALDAQVQPRSSIEIAGHDVHLLNNSLVQAHAGKVDIKALDDQNSPSTKGDARIFMEGGSKIDVSGIKKVKVAADADIVELKLQSNELRDSPLQRKNVGILFGETVKADLRDATVSHDNNGNLVSAKLPIADITGAAQRRARNIDERSSAAGSITLTSSGDVVTNSGSVLDFSGGSVEHLAGYVTTSKLVSGTRLFEIGSADPNLTYTRVINSPRPVYRDSYIEGKAGGSLKITSYAAFLEGSWDGGTENGPFQREPQTWPVGSRVEIDLSNDNTLGKQDVVFGATGSSLVLGPGDPIPFTGNAGEPVALRLDTGRLKRSGIKNLKLTTNGAVTVETDAQLTLPEGGELELNARNFSVDGQLIAHGGRIDLKPVVIQGRSQPSAINLGASSKLDVSGIWVNDWLDVRNGRDLSQLTIDAGKVNLVAEQSRLFLARGSSINADAGAWKNAEGKILTGKSGAISLTAVNNLPAGTPANLVIEDKLSEHFSAWGLEQNGVLSLKTQQVIIGRQTDQSRLNGSASPLVVDEDFLSQGGFSDYEFVSNVHGLTLADDVQLHLSQTNRQLTTAASLAGTGSGLREISKAVVLPGYLRKPTDLTLSFSEVTDQDRTRALILGRGSLIETDPGGSVTLNSDTSIYVNGTIKTPGGNIGLNIIKPRADRGYFASQGIWLSGSSRLLAAGAVVPQVSFNGLSTGLVLAGGTVNLSATRGFIVSQLGSQIDVSGISAPLSATRFQNGVASLIPGNTLASAGGEIKLAAGEGILADGRFDARAGGVGVAGGSLSVLLDRSLRDKPSPALFGGRFPDDITPSIATTLTVTSNGATLAPSNWGGDIAANLSQKAWLKSDLINSAGFSSVKLQTDVIPIGGQLTSTIVFEGNQRLSASRQIQLDTTLLKTTGARVDIDAPYVALGSTQVRNNSGVSTLAPNAVTGPGSLIVNAQGIDLIGGLSFNGFNRLDLNSQGDLRLIGTVGLEAKNFLGQLNLAGNLNISANQVYPATLTNYTINLSSADATFTLQGNGISSAPVLSAGGRLTVNAANILQRGTLRASFGNLNLNVSKNLVLASGSLTSVSGAGSVVPFGVVSGGGTWLYPLTNSTSPNIVVDAASVPDKSLALTGNSIDLQQGAAIDLSGGGNLYAYEFIPGIGGSYDVLNPASPGYTEKYAVIPGIHSIQTPYDPLEFSNAGLKNGDSVFLQAGAGLAAGWYSLLPAHYALLPGAYLVTPVPGTQGLLQNTVSTAGVTIVAGRYGVAGTTFQDPLTQGFEIQAGSLFTGSLSYAANGSTVVNTNPKSPSQFDAYTATEFFAKQAAQDGSTAPQLPADAGRLLISANNSLNLSAQLLANPFGNGLGGQVDISADRLRVVNNSQDLAALPSGTVGLLASQLNNLNAPSLLLGGKRVKSASGERLTIKTANLSVDSGVDLRGRELLLAAGNQLTIASGAEIASSGKTGTGGGTLLLDNVGGNSNGAFLRVSANAQIDVVRDKTTNTSAGVLVVGEGATLKADGSVLLDSSKDTRFDGDIDMVNGGSLGLSSSRISIGNAPDGTSGLVLTKVPLNLDDIRFKSASDFDIYGTAQISSKNLTISAATINGFNQANQLAQVNATDTFTLTNNGAESVRSGSGIGGLQLNANNIVLGSGAYAISGFNQVEFNAIEAINGAGQTVDKATGNTVTAKAGTLRVAGDVAMTANHFSGGNGATISIDAESHRVAMSSPQTNMAALPVGLGVSWTVKGGSIDSSARFDLPSGRLDLLARNGDINLNAGSVIDLSGRGIVFADRSQFSPAGALDLTSATGNISLAERASINLAGVRQFNGGVVQQVGDAGTLNIRAERGRFNWLGTIDALAGTQNQIPGVARGSLTLSVDNFGDGGFSNLNAKLSGAGFTENLSLEQNSDDIFIAANDQVKARNFSLAANRGAITVAGTLDVSADKAGAIEIYGRNGVTLAATSKIIAKSTSGEGGSVLLDTVHRDDAGSGVLDLSASGALIDVGGGSGGSVHLRTGRNVADQVSVSEINTRIKGTDPARTALEATRIYQQSLITALEIDAWRLDTDSFMAARPLLSNGSGTVIDILPGIEVRSTSDLTLQDKWDFMAGAWSNDTSAWVSNWRYFDAAGDRTLPGFLTLNAAGDLLVQASLTDAFATTPLSGAALDPSQLFLDVIQPGRSWSYTLKAGKTVNLAASFLDNDPLGSGTQVASQVVVRTGTGDIDISAGNDILFNIDPNNSNRSNNASAVYTVGTTAPYTITQLLAGTVPGLPGQGIGQSLDAYLAGFTEQQLNQVLRYGFFDESFLGSRYIYAEYPTHGGDINLNAGRDVRGVQTGQQISDWLVRGGTWNYTAAQRGGVDPAPTAWGINLSGNLYYSQTSSEFFMPDGESVGNIYGKDNRNFNQNVGALGGGNVNVQAKGDVKDLSVIIPTTGKPTGTLSSLGVWSDNGEPLINGGGDLLVKAGSDIVGGEYFVALGTGDLIAGGAIAKSLVPGTTTPIGVLLELGDGVFNIQARQDIDLGSVFNPTILAQQSGIPGLAQTADTRFFSYGSQSAVNLLSTAGNLNFLNDYQSIVAAKHLQGSQSGVEYTIYPGTLRAASLSGDIYIDNSMSLFPSVDGEFELLANRNIGIDPVAAEGQRITINMSDTDPNFLPGFANPAIAVDGSYIDGRILTRELFDPASSLPQTIHASTPLHLGDTNKPLIMAKLGNIAFSADEQVGFYLPQAADFLAGGNIVNLSISTQNLTSDDVTLLKAGGNISYGTRRDADGLVKSNDQFIIVGGPGQLQVIAGGSVSLGSSQGIQTIGGLLNQALGNQGASIELVAGLKDVFDVSNFINNYGIKLDESSSRLKTNFVYLISKLWAKVLDPETIDPANVSSNEISVALASLSSLGVPLSTTGVSTTGASVNEPRSLMTALEFDALVRSKGVSIPDLRFKKLEVLEAELLGRVIELQDLKALSSADQLKHLDMVLGVLFKQFEYVAYQAAIVPIKLLELQPRDYFQIVARAYSQGTAAWQALFPGSGSEPKYAGDLAMTFSQIITLAGGGINLLTPGGQINVGLAGTQGGVSKSADQLGIVVQQKGDLNIYSLGNVNVNQSRVFTLGGGNITAWSSGGDIDAGKGSKGAISAPPPITTIDANGNIVTVFPPIISGSGIQAIGGGNVTLAAPKGIVDAGEAGISGNDVTVAALLVVNQNNISSDGSRAGGNPPPSPVIPTGADAAATGAAKSAGDAPAAGNKDDKDDKGDKKKASVAMLNADVIGYGQCSVGDVKEGKSGCGG